MVVVMVAFFLSFLPHHALEHQPAFGDYTGEPGHVC